MNSRTNRRSSLGLRVALTSIAGALIVASTVAGLASISPEDHELFETRIRPLLDQRCGTCHGEDALGDLRVDSRSALVTGGASGPAIVVGKPDESLLIQAVRHEIPKLEMPMTGSKLTVQQIADLSTWIERGAPWPGEPSTADAANDVAQLVTAEDRAFWSYGPLEKTQPPEVSDADWNRTPIDRFIRHSLDEAQLSPVDTASKTDLLRRLSYDLIGLPPTPEEVSEFLADDRPDAWQRTIERLLDSPHYGERWGRHWLDVVRYGEDDTRGLAEDGSGRERYAQAFRYRDWVVEALNDDMPWPRFVEAQLAADLLPEDQRQDLLPALGLLGAGPWYYDLAEPATARADERYDRVDVVTRGFLALTVGCARCHNHKYDAIPTADYYALAGLFSNSEYHEYPIGTAEQVAGYEKDKEFRKLLRQSRRQFLREEGQQLTRVLIHQIADYMMGAWKVTGEPKLEAQRVANQDRLDLELLNRYIEFLAKEPRNYPNLKDWQAMIAAGGEDEVQKKRAQELADRFQREIIELAEARRKLEEQNEYIIANGSKPPSERKSVPMPNGFESFFDEHQLELESLSREQMLLAQDVFDIDVDKTTDYYDPVPGLLRFWGWSLERQLSAQAREHVDSLDEQIEELRKPENQLPFVMGVRDLEPERLTDIRLHLRGSPHNLGSPVPRHFPTVLSPEDNPTWTEGSGRLQFAKATATHPLTARVIVNRVWRWHFGTGLVDTPSNFGKMGERPSHPELLEYLAARFVEEGQSLKWLHRQILSSRTYQLAATSTAANHAKDPDNRLYWRGNRQRLDAESIRDTLLAASGNLDRTVGGRSQSLADPENSRRTVYGTVSRFQVDTYLQTFDFPNPGITAEKRFVTNVPLQNLYFMNSDFVARQAKALAKRLATPKSSQVEGEATALGPIVGVGTTAVDVETTRVPSDRERITRAYLLLYGRAVTEGEMTLGLDFLADARARSKSAETESTAPADATPDALEPASSSDTSDEPEAAWVQYARALMSANELRFVS